MGIKVVDDINAVLGKALPNRSVQVELIPYNITNDNSVIRVTIDGVHHMITFDMLSAQKNNYTGIIAEVDKIISTYKHTLLPVNLTFGQALEAIKDGHKVARIGWNGKNMFVFLVPGSTFRVNRAPLLGIYPEGTEIKYCPHIDMKTADGSIVPWLASQTDVLAEDWEVLA